MIDLEYLNECVKYDPDTGSCLWKRRPDHHFSKTMYANTWNTKYSGKEVGCVKSFRSSVTFYRSVRINGSFYMVHRLAYFIHYGEWPDVIDHVDGNGLNNKIENLRSVTRHENNKNMPISKANSSGYVGVCWVKREKKWRASVTVNRKQIHLGYFDDLNDALLARAQGLSNHGFHENHGRQL